MPPQKSSDTLLAAMVIVWNELPDTIRPEQNMNKWKKKIAAFCSEAQEKYCDIIN
jgi:hypothetical protein